MKCCVLLVNIADIRIVMCTKKAAQITNADKIRNMADEELAKWLNYYAHDGYINPSCGWLKWLEQIVDQKRGM